MLDSHLQLSCFRHDGNFLCRCSVHKAWESRTLCKGESSYPNNFISFTLPRQHLVVIIATKHGAGFATKIHFYPIPWKYFLLFHAAILFMPYGNEWKRFGQAKISLNCFQKIRQLLVVWNIVYSLYTNLIKAFWQLYDSVPN